MPRSGRIQHVISLVVALVLCLGVVQGKTTDDPTSAATTVPDSTAEDVTTTRLPTTTERPDCQTKVDLRDKNHKPIKGQDLELECFNTTRCDTTVVPQWYKDENDTYTIGSGTILKLENLDTKKDDGDYSCRLVAGVGGTPYKLTVGTRPAVKMVGPPGPVVKGSNVTIECNLDSGTPKPTIEWTLDGNKLSDILDEIYDIVEVDHEDQGLYRCMATNDIGSGYGIYNLDVLYPPVGKPSITPTVSALIAGTEENFMCDISSLVDRGNPGATRYQWMNFNNPRTEETQMITLHSKSVLDEFNLTCTLANYYGASSEAVHMGLKVEAPVIFEKQPTPEGNDTVFLYKPNYNGNFNLTYIISGSHFTELKLFRYSSGEELLTEKYFKYDNETKNGTFSYSQDKAFGITLKWNRDKKRGIDVCSNLTYFDDVYTLQALGTAASTPSEANSTFRIETQFQPHWNGVNPHVIRGKIGESVTIECNVCANPPPTTYTWTYKYVEDLPDGIEKNDRKLIIKVLRDGHLGEYGCQVNNKEKTFVIRVEGIKATPVGVIAGSVVGIVVFLGVIIAVIVVCVVKRKKKAPEGSRPDAETQSLDELSENRSSRPKPKTKPKPVLPGADECRPHNDYPHDTPPPVPSGPRPNYHEDDEDDHVYQQDVEPQEIYDDIGDLEDDYITPTEGNEYVERGKPHNSYHQRGRYQH